MGADDANDDGPGECPGHEWGAGEIHVDGFRLRIVHECRWCSALSYEASRGDSLGGLDGT